MIAVELPGALQILAAACQKFGYEFTVLDSYSKHLVEVSRGEKSFITGGGILTLYPLNLSTPSQIANDKAHTYTLLKAKNFRIPKGDYFFLKPEYRELRGDGKELADAFLFAEGFGYPVFVKPNRGSHGNFAEVVHDENELRVQLEKIADYTSIALLQEVLRGNEYRIFVVDGVVQYAYQRVAPHATGDAIHTIQELLDHHNTAHNLKPDHIISGESPYLANKLRQEKFSVTTILPAGKTLQIAAKSNLSVGGCISDYTEIVSEECSAWAKKVAATMNLRVCGIDIFSTANLEHPENFTILEVNRNPSLRGIYEMGGQEKVFAIWKEILEKYFSEVEKTSGK